MARRIRDDEDDEYDREYKKASARQRGIEDARDERQRRRSLRTLFGCIGCSSLIVLLPASCCVIGRFASPPQNTAPLVSNDNPRPAVVVTEPIQKPKKTNSNLSPGDIAYVDFPTDQSVLGAKDHASLDELTRRLRIKDPQGIATLAAAGKLFEVQGKTKVRITDIWIMTIQGRVIEGPQSGKELIFVREWLQPVSN